MPLFSYRSQRELAKVAKLANELELPAGHTLIHEDAEVAYSFFVLVDGEAEVRRRNRRVATLGPSDCLGSSDRLAGGTESPKRQLFPRD